MKSKLESIIPFLLPIASGIFLFLSYPPYDIGFLRWMALIPLFIFLNFKSIGPGKAFLGGFIGGFIFLGKILSWLFEVYPLDWIGIEEKELTLFLIYILWLISAGFFALFIGFFSWIFRALKRKVWLTSILAPSLWIIFEYLRAWGFGILWIGPGALLGPHWTLGNLGYTLHQSENFRQIANLGGLYGLSFYIVLINILIFFFLVSLIKKKNKNSIKLAVIIFSLFLIASIFGFWTIKNIEASQKDKPKISIALFQTNFSSNYKYDASKISEIYQTYLNFLKKVPAQTQIIIFPEGGYFSFLQKDWQFAQKNLKEIFGSKPLLFIDNFQLKDKEGNKSRLSYWNLEKGEIVHYDKRFLMPGGEYLPYLLNILKIFGKKGWIDNFNQKRTLSAGKIPSVVAESRWGKIGGLICSGVISPSLNRNLVKNGAEFLVTVSSDAVFRGSPNLLSQNLAMSQIKAVGNGRYFAQSTNMGYSFIINPWGNITEKSSKLENAIVSGDIYFINKKTPYTILGDWILIIAGIIVIISVSINCRKSNIQ